MSDTVGVLFCGGEGTRMRPLTYYIQKVMMPIGVEQRPVMEYVVNHFKKHGVTDLIFLVNYKKKQIEGYFEDGSRWDMNITYVPDKPGPKGTGTALLNAKHAIGDRRIIVYYSDIITNVNFTEMLSFHANHKKWATIFASKGWKIRVGTADITQDKQVTKFIEKPTIPVMVNTGKSILEPIVFDYLRRLNPELSIDLSRDIFPKFVEEKQMMAYIPEQVYWEDVGDMARYSKLDHEKISSLMH